MLIPEINLDLQIKINSQIIKKEEDDCWLWIGSCKGRKEKNQPTIGINYKDYLVTRIIYKLYYNQDPGNLQVNHTRIQGGHNPRCLNPKHLYLGTQSDNMKDREIDGNGYHGQVVKYPNEIIYQIRKLYKTGRFTQKELADIFKMSDSNICRILTYTIRKN